MKFSLSWLERHLDTTACLDEIVEAMIAAGLEVEEVEDPKTRLADFTVGHVLEAEKHPDADKLKVCKVATKDGEKQIVCGAPNARAGMKVAYAAVGTYVPGIDVTLAKAKIRGVESFGMMCSARELEIGEDHDGILDLPAEAQVGAPVVDVLDLDDPVIDFEVTPNRPDTNGVLAVARDLAAAGLGTLKDPSIAPTPGTFKSPQAVGLHFEAGTKTACPIFIGRYIKGVKNGPSPEWLQKLLLSVGLRPINALVDVTNFISCDRARPLHVYDADKLQGEIHARLGKKGETFTALDDKDYEADETMCVIADDSGAIGFGGVMGGLSTGCTDGTVNVFIEAAYFDPVRTRKTGQKTGIVSDARYRFERGIDPQSCTEGAELATQLILEACGGEASYLVVAGQAPAGRPDIAFKPSEVKRLTGIEMAEDEMASILAALGFGVAKSDVWTVRVPSWRPDMEGAADLVEEITRIKGFDALTSTPLPALEKIPTPKITPAQNRARRARHALAARGLNEAVTWSFTHSADAARFCDGENWLKAQGLILENPISSDLDAMRPSVLPNLIRALQRNTDHGTPDLALFEVGPQYAGDRPEDQTQVAAGARRSNPPRHWRGSAAPVDVFTAKADAFLALEAAGAPTANLQATADAPAYYHPGRSGVLRLGPKNALAFFGELHPRMLKQMDVDGPVYAFEVFLDNIPPAKQKATKTKAALNASDLLPLSRDFAFVVAADTPAGALLKAAQGADKKLITGVQLFDVYEGEHVGEGKKSLAIEVMLQPKDKTLTDEEIEAVGGKIVKAVEKATGGVLRG
ncbi:MAG: phenylalanine--tRNA ligase subunit beta [Pseudomonadota bacterium]